MVWVELKLTPQALVARNKVRRLIALAKLTEHSSAVRTHTESEPQTRTASYREVLLDAMMAGSRVCKTAAW